MPKGTQDLELCVLALELLAMGYTASKGASLGHLLPVQLPIPYGEQLKGD